MRHTLLALCILIALLCLPPASSAQAGVTQVCPAVDLEPRAAVYAPGGMILASFDRSALWVYDIDRDRRYPLPETFACPFNCRLSPDGRWLLYFNDLTNAFNRMRVDGTQRSLVATEAAQVEYWSGDTYLVWTPERSAYLLNGDTREPLDVRGIVSVQPGGRWGISIQPDGDNFDRALVNLLDRTQSIPLGMTLTYYEDAAWSPDGRELAYVKPLVNEANMPVGSEMMVVSPEDTAPRQVTALTDTYGAVRINGLASSALSWSPDGTRIAFWIIPLNAPAMDAVGQRATLHILDLRTGQLNAFCRATATQHTPNPPRLIWSPDGSHITYGTDLDDDTRPSLLLALDTASGVVAILSEGLYPVLGAPDVTAWGQPPG